MPRAWGILAAAFLALALLEFALHPWIATHHFRPTQFFGASPQTLPTPWPTPQALAPLTTGHIHTYPGKVRRLLAPPAAGRQRSLRIAYFADSITEGDLICSTLRERLQERFGGQGLGWVGIAPIDAWARDDIQQTFGAEWERHSIFKPGWEGQAFGPGGSAWHLAQSPGAVTYHASGGLPGTKLLAPATLWYGPLGPAGAELDIEADGGARSQHLEGKGPLNHAVLSQGSLHTLGLSFKADPAQPFYGVSFDQGSGIDNFSTRGSHGGPLQRLDLKMLQELQAQRHYQIVLVHYGINALVIRSDPEYKWYRRELAAGLRQLQAGLSGTAMVLITATDRGVHDGDAWVSDPYLPGMLAAQEAAAADVGVPYINAFDLMGGPGSMKAWAEAQPRLAEHDYTHLSPLGAKRFGESLWLALQHLGQTPAPKAGVTALKGKL